MTEASVGVRIGLQSLLIKMTIGKRFAEIFENCERFFLTVPFSLLREKNCISWIVFSKQ